MIAWLSGAKLAHGPASGSSYSKRVGKVPVGHDAARAILVERAVAVVVRALGATPVEPDCPFQRVGRDHHPRVSGVRKHAALRVGDTHRG